MTPQEIYEKYGYYMLPQKPPEIVQQPTQQAPVRSPYQYQQPSQQQPQQQPARRGGCCGKR